MKNSQVYYEIKILSTIINHDLPLLTINHH